MMDTFWTGPFWACAIVALYAYVLYPLVVWTLAQPHRRCASPRAADAAPPSVSLLIAAHNEQDVIAARIDDALRLDYPRDLLQIVVASDGSSDQTPAIVRRYTDQGVVLLDFVRRRGKAAVLNDAFRHLRSEVVVLSDANTTMAPDAVRALARWFSAPEVGIVCGRLDLRDPATGRNVDSLYWRYETFLKRCESRLGALLGANGAIYAVRRSLFTGIRSNTIVDDFVLPLVTRLRTGCRIVYDADAVAYEESPAGIGDEFRRRSRIGAGGFQSLSVLWRLMHPREGWLAFTFLSHKVARWVCPFALVGCLVANVALAGHPPYRMMLIAQLAAYVIAAAGCFTSGPGAASRLARLATMFASMNAALLVGFWTWIRGTGDTGVWDHAAR
jgi:cellulose synthase/poly-beta-1,6-N-acetylglucosamine synthase-like glycosyltransferase